MKKLIIVFMLLALFGCSSSGDNGGSSSNDSYIGFTAEDFSGKIIYLVETDIGWSKAVFNADGSVEAYDPNQENWYAKGTWEIVNGKLVVAREESPDHKTTYTFINEDAENNI